MVHLQLLLSLLLSLNMQVEKPNIESIYVGKSFLWTVYYDSEKKLASVVEIGGIKYGYLDKIYKSDNYKKGKLYYKSRKLHYKNDFLNIDLKLEQKKYSKKIDYHRQKLFEINAFNEITRLKDSLNVENYEFDWNVKSDYIFYRDNHAISEDYKPEYIKKFYKSLKYKERLNK